MNDLEILKKKFGEKFSRLCRNLFPTLLETEGLLSQTILSHFAPTRSLYEDLIKHNLTEEFKNYIYSVSGERENQSIEVDATPEELMDKAGYVLYKCETDEDVKQFMKYYKDNEKLCTFRDSNRINTHTIFFAVKKNVDEIRRENFRKPLRQDEYGTSVISLQFSKKYNSLSIKNRYNHTVLNCDATFSNDLENIYPGLTQSFEKHYNLKVKSENYNFEIPGYVIANDNKAYRYNYEIYTKYFCENNVLISVGDAIQYDKNRYELFDYFVLDKVEKKISCPISGSDSFVQEFENIDKIEITKDKDTGNRTFKIINTDNTHFSFKVNKHNQIIGYTNEYQRIMNSTFLVHNETLTEISVPALEIMKKKCFLRNTSLKEFYAPNLLNMESQCLWLCNNLEILNVPKLEYIGNDCLQFNRNLKEMYAPNLKIIRNNVLTENENLKELNAPSLESVGYAFLHNNKNLTNLYVPNLKEIGDSVLSNNLIMQTFNAPKLERIGNYFLNNNTDLVEFNAPSLKIIGDYSLNYNKQLRSFNVPSIEYIGNNILTSNENLKEFNAPLLTRIGKGFLSSNNSLKVFTAPKLTNMGERTLLLNNSLEELNLPSLKVIGKSCLAYNKVLKNVNIPNLQVLIGDALQNYEHIEDLLTDLVSEL